MPVLSPDDQTLTEVANGGIYYAQLASGDHMSAEYFRVEPGCGASGHRHSNEQMGVMIGEPGAAHTFVIDETDEFVLHPGETFSIPSNVHHKVTNESDQVVEIVNFFSPARSSEFLEDSLGTPNDS